MPAFDTGLVSLYTAPRIYALSARQKLTNTGTTKGVVGEMGTGSIATTLFETSSTQLPSLLPWLQRVSPRG